MSVDSASDRSRWKRYDAWNAGVEREFFAGQWAHRPVYLDLEADLLRRIADAAGEERIDPAKALMQAVRPTLHPRPDGVSLLSEHLARATRWRIKGRRETPPFLAVLAFLSLVAEGMRSDGDFRASNYYGRLSRAMGVEPGDHNSEAKVQRGFMDESHVLWAALNGWLEDNHGRFGLPTAYAFDYRVHVGIPMSQALVRESDRLALRELFTDYRLQPGQSLARSDMARLLEDWLPRSPVSAGLQHMAEKREALDRIADVACIELEAWDGTRAESPATPRASTPLLLAAGLRRQPRPRLYFDVVTPSATSLPSGPYRLGDDASAHARAALEGLSGAVRLAPPTAGGWRPVEDAERISVPDLLLTRTQLSANGAVLERDPRRLVILELDEETRRFVEVARVQLGRENLLLCHTSLQAQLEPVLEEIARPGYAVRDPVELSGLPADWLAYDPIEVMRISDVALVDLAPLVPLSWTQVALGGGFPLPARSTWLRGQPPEVRVSAFVNRTVSARLLREHRLEDQAEDPPELARFMGSAIVSLEACDLDDGDYRIVLTEDGARGAALGSTSLRIRSADHPRELLGGQEPPLRHDLDAGPWAALSASETEVEAELEDGGGAATTGRPNEARLVLPPQALELQLDDEDRDPDPIPEAAAPQGGDAPLCLLGGGHHFVLEPADRHARYRKEIDGLCKHCGLEKWFPVRPWGRKSRRGKRGAAQAATGPQRAPLEVRPIETGGSPDFDALCEALCFARRGSWSSFDALASRVDDAPWFPLETARLLSSLGHINLRLDQSSCRIDRWSVTAPTLVATGSASAVLCGRRWGALVAQLDEQVRARGAGLVAQDQSDAPRRLLIEGLEATELERVAQECGQALGTRIGASASGAAGLAEQLPPMGDLVDALPQLERAIGARTERFAFDRNKWERVAELDAPGAYRFLSRPIVYAVRLRAQPGLRIADNRLAKWLAGWDAGLAMLAYDTTTHTLLCPLGAQLPGLYERAAVLCSGRPPTPQSDGTVVYHDVTNGVAARLWRSLRPTVREATLA